jgi:rhodanese-related sulfurtransferase
MTCRSVPAVEAAEMIAADPGVVLLDVRTPEEYDGELGHLRGALLIPVHELTWRLTELDAARGKEILVYCRTGRRSLAAADILRKNGHTAINVEGGMVEWNELKLPGVEYRG